jgi:hypothetical protein
VTVFVVTGKYGVKAEIGFWIGDQGSFGLRFKARGTRLE